MELRLLHLWRFWILWGCLVFWVFGVYGRGVTQVLLSPVSGPGPIFQPLVPMMAPMESTAAASVVSPPSSSSEMDIVATEKDTHHWVKKLVLSTSLISSAAILIMLALFRFCFYRRKNRNKSRYLNQSAAADSNSIKGFTLGPILSKFNSSKASSKKGSTGLFEYKLLEKGTDNFNETNIIGSGGFGSVYKACLDEGVFVAVKKLDDGGSDCEKEFENEIELLSKIKHPNIISLVGHSVNGQTKFLVYELMQNGSLETQLHGHSHGSPLTWPIRMKIALDAARGLEYLHEHCNPPIIHRDLKSSNILLDSGFNAKVSDFGLAVTNVNRYKSGTKLSGTLGYVAPEYILDGKLTDKSDVYAFGVVLLELLLGRKPVEKLGPSQYQSIVTWAMPQLTDRSKLPGIVDPMVKDTMDLKHLYQVAAVAILCVQPEPSYRPLITDVLHSLVPLVAVEHGGTLRATDPSTTPN
ncbi:Kinase family protein [Zostera marina]|uniref:Kinase family protein n=1 Tax=Zostera marina TaxID=29655 RepID=A0A0K9NXJ4_ZOSMR|nr:Kinase family protein [Zostera marina]